ncbi:hypothetical protein BT96DRAFT_746769, partial [Gymnopus androsaceus JB14]
ELDHYLQDNCVQTDDPLQWWIMNQKVCVLLSLYFYGFSFSFKFFASSVAVERMFLHGRILISHLHNQLRAETICALM